MRIKIFCLLGTMAALCAFDAYSEEEPTLLYSQAPEFVAADVSANILVCGTRRDLYGYDMDSGQERWHYGLKEQQSVQSRFNSSNNILLSVSPQEYSVLCKATGKMVYEISDNEERSSFHVISVPGTNWIQSVKFRIKEQKDQRVVYSPDGAKQFDVPTNCLLGGVMPDGKTAFGVKTIQTEGKTTEKEVCFWELGNDVIDRSFSIDQDVQGWLIGMSFSDNTMLFQRRLKDKDIYEFVIVDVLGGNIQRTIPVPEAADHNCILTPDGTGIVVLSRDEQTVWLLNSTDGTLLSTLNMPDHPFLWDTISYDSAGNPYIVSKDGQNNAWLWAVAPDAVPRKIFDGSRYFSGTIAYFKPPYFLTTEDYDNPPDENVPYTLLSIFRMEDGHIQKVDAWPVVGCNFYAWNCSDDMQRLKVWRDSYLKTISPGVVVYEKGKTEPIIEIQTSNGRFSPIAISPDGSHIVVREDEKTIKVIHVDSENEVAALYSEAHTWDDRVTLFSPDGHRVAVYHHPYLTVVNLVHGYRQVIMYIPEAAKSFDTLPIQFSTMDDRLLSCGEGKVWLHDSDTGELLKTFVEPKRFTNKHVHINNAPDFINIASNALVDTASNFTNYAKEIPWIECAFAENDTQVLTIAEEQLLRVWDACSGKQLKVLEIRPLSPYAFVKSWRGGGNVALSPNGEYAYVRGQARLWDIKLGRLIGEYRVSKVPKDQICFSDDNSGIYFWKNDAVYYLPIQSRK